MMAPDGNELGDRVQHCDELTADQTGERTSATERILALYAAGPVESHDAWDTLTGVVPSEHPNPKKTTFGTAGGKTAPFFFMSGLWIRAAAESAVPTWPLSVRLWMLALSRMDKHGHATFGKGELAAALPIVTKKTGELRHPDARTVRSALDFLRKARLVTPDSTTRCIRISQNAAQFPAGPDKFCAIHQ